MHPIFKKVQEKVGKPYIDLHFLLQCLSEVLESNQEHSLIKYIPWMNENIKVPEDGLEQKVIHLHSICFQLLNLCEVNWAVQGRRAKQQTEGSESINGSWAQTFSELKKNNIDKETILKTLSQIDAEPVLTAHPTEAKRIVVLKYYRELYLQLVLLENSMYNSIERNRIRNEIKEILNRLWFIDDIYLEKPKVETELENIIYYLTNVFPDVFMLFDRQVVEAWEGAGFEPADLSSFRNLPRVTLGTWVGGDRDGHPLVTPDITKFALRKLRTESLRLVREKLSRLADNLSIYTAETQLPSYFIVHKNKIKAQVQEMFANSSIGSDAEPIKQYVLLLIEKLPIKIDIQTGNSQVSDGLYTYTNSSHLIQDLELLFKALIDWGAPSIATNEVNKTLRFVYCFGFHLAHLDIRQNSNYYHKALIGLLQEDEVLNSYVKDGEIDKCFFQKELRLYRPFSRQYQGDVQETINVLGYFNVLAEHISRYGAYALGPLIVSMTRNAEDLYMVYLFAREVGMIEKTETGPACKLPVVPLFETLDDLQRAPEIMDEFLAHPLTRNTLLLDMKRKGYRKPVVEIMIGYSDSNKDAGVIASQWALFESQYKLSAIAKKHEVEIRFFHGKGGSISRGAGPMHWFMRSLPPGSLSGKMRLTDQGETIERKYANKVNAAFNLELLASGTLLNTILHNDPVSDELFNLMHYMAEESYQAYTRFTQHPGFIRFFELATPIDAIETSKIGSRPSRRTNQRTLQDLRAIPWVFSWSQCRINMTSWFGVGSTLKALKTKQPEKYQLLKQLILTHPMVRYLFTNIDSGMAATDPKIIELYAGLVNDKEVKESILPILMTEYQLSTELLSELLNRPFEERRPHHYHSTQLRAVALQPLHEIQTRTLEQWREGKNNADPALLEKQNIILLKTINAIANALWATG